VLAWLKMHNGRGHAARPFIDCEGLQYYDGFKLQRDSTADARAYPAEAKRHKFSRWLDVLSDLQYIDSMPR
jgi:hypothetical protein